MNVVKRHPIRTDLEDGVRCTSRFAGRRCRFRSGHGGAHEALSGPDVAPVRWGGRRRKRP
jgi:hypothetical protein